MGVPPASYYKAADPPSPGLRRGNRGCLYNLLGSDSFLFIGWHPHHRVFRGQASTLHVLMILRREAFFRVTDRKILRSTSVNGQK